MLSNFGLWVALALPNVTEFARLRTFHSTSEFSRIPLRQTSTGEASGTPPPLLELSRHEYGFKLSPIVDLWNFYNRVASGQNPSAFPLRNLRNFFTKPGNLTPQVEVLPPGPRKTMGGFPSPPASTRGFDLSPSQALTPKGPTHVSLHPFLSRTGVDGVGQRLLCCSIPSGDHVQLPRELPDRFVLLDARPDDCFGLQLRCLRVLVLCFSKR